MAVTSSAAMELKVLISVLQSGNSLQTMLKQVQDLSQALTKLQAGVPGAGSTGTPGSAAAATTAANALGAAAQQAAAGVAAAGTAATKTSPQMAKLEDVINKVTRAVKFLAGGFLALSTVQFLKGLADVAARTEVLETVLHVVALNAGYTSEAIDDASTKIQRLGITAQSAADSLTQFLQAGLKLDFAPKLARAAQDLAVVSGMDSSATFQRLIVNIQQLDTMGLRHMGIIVSRTEAEQKYASSLHTTANALTQKQKQEALMAAVIEKAAGLEGAYEAAMGNVGKQLTSLTRLSQGLRNEIGKFLLPSYSAIVSELSLFLQKMNDLAAVQSLQMDGARQLGETVRWVARQFFTVVEYIVKYREAIYTLVAAYGAYWAIVTGKALWAHLITVVGTLTETVNLSVKAIKTATVATYEWIVALNLLNATRAAGTKQAAVQTGTQLVFDFMKEAKSLDKATQLSFAFMEEAPAKVTLLARVMGLLARAMGVLSTVAQAIVAFFTSLTGVITLLVLAMAAGTAMILTYTKAGAEASKSFGLLKDVLKELSQLLSGGFQFGMQLLVNIFRAGAGVAKSATDEIGKFIKILADIPGNPISNAVRGIEQLNIAFGYTRDILRELNEDLEQYLEKQAGNKGGDKIIAQIERQNALLMQQREVVTEATNAAVEAAVRTRSRFSDDYLAAEKNLKLEKAKETAIQDRIDVLRKRLQARDPLADAREKQEAARNAKIVKDAELAKAAMDALDRLLTTSVSAGSRLGDVIITPKEFGEKIGMLRGLSAELFKLQQNAASAARGIGGVVPEVTAETIQQTVVARQNVVEGFKGAIGSVRSPEALKQIRAEYELVRQSLTPEQNIFVSRLLEAGAITAREGDRALFAPLEAIRVAAFRRREAALANHLETEMALLRTANERVLSLEKERFDKGLSSVEEYFAIRRELQQKEYFLRVTQAQNEVASAQREIAAGIGFSIPEQIAARQKLEEKQQALKRVIAEEPAQSAGLDVEERQAVTQATRALTDGLLENAIAFGSEAAALEKVDEQFIRRKEQLQTLRPGDARNDQVAQGERTLAQLKINLEFSNKQLDVDLESNRVARERLTLDRARTDAETQRINVAEQLGVISTVEARRLRNAQVFRKLDEDEQDRQLKLEELQKRRTALGQQYALIVAAQAKGGKGEFDPETVARVNQELGGLRNQIKGLEGEVITLDASIDTAFGNLQLYATELKDHFVDSFADALTETITNFKNAGSVWLNFARGLANEIVGVFTKALTQRLFANLSFAWVDRLLGVGGGGGLNMTYFKPGAPPVMAEGGLIQGPGTGTSDSVPIMASAGEHIMPAAKTAQFYPLLEGIRTGKILPFQKGGVVQSIALGSIIPRRYAGGGVVVADGGAAAVQTGQTNGNMNVRLDPESMNMTMRDWLEHEVARQQSRR